MWVGTHSEGEMAKPLEVTEYYELVALHKALIAARFARKPLMPFLSGSPYLSEIARRVVDILSEMEVERGRPEQRNNWQIKIRPDSEVWQIAVKNAATESDFWNKQSKEKKTELAKIFLSPFVISDEILDLFIDEVDETAQK